MNHYTTIFFLIQDINVLYFGLFLERFQVVILFYFHLFYLIFIKLNLFGISVVYISKYKNSHNSVSFFGTIIYY